VRFAVTVAILAVASFAFSVACLDEDEACAQEGDDGIVETIPWSDVERSEYVWLDHDDPTIECGSGVLTTDVMGAETELGLHFESLPNDDGEINSDTSTITVDSETLEPFFVSRERVIDGEEESVTGEYDRENEEIRVLEYTGEDDEDPRSIPRSLDEEVFYDNESSLFLWRTIPLEEDLVLTYTAVLVNQGGTQREVTLRVVERESVTVPAGTFEAWRVDISTEDVDQVAFIADTPERQLVFYDNSVQVFQLTSYER